MLGGLAGKVEGRLHEHRRGDVGMAHRRIAPAAVLVLAAGQPSDRAGGECGEAVAAGRFLIVPRHHAQGAYRRGRRQRGTGKLADPMPGGISLRQQILAGRLKGGQQLAGIDHAPSHVSMNELS